MTMTEGNMTMKIIRGYEDIISIVRDSPVVVWGAGRRGRTFLQEIRVHHIKNVYIYDENSSNMSDIDERISLKDIKSLIDKITFVIAVADDKTVDEILSTILNYNIFAEVYRYIPKGHTYLNNVLNGEGFYNGESRQKALESFSAKELLKQKIRNKEPFLCSRWGSVEGNTVYADKAGLFIESENFSLKNNAGFYPLDKHSIRRFVKYSINAAQEIDILIAGVWCPRVEELYRLYSPESVLVTDAMMCPFWEDVSWTSALKGKRVLVIHPFAKLIEKQYRYRDKLFKAPDILPEMELIVYQAVQSMNGSAEFASWFEALEKMKADISSIDFDVALIGCGAYGMPLGAFIKTELRKSAVHMGGSLQLLFGIKGKRWEGNGYDYHYKLYNEYWVRPTDDLKPENYKNVESGCYW